MIEYDENIIFFAKPYLFNFIQILLYESAFELSNKIEKKMKNKNSMVLYIFYMFELFSSIETVDHWNIQEQSIRILNDAQ